MRVSESGFVLRLRGVPLQRKRFVFHINVIRIGEGGGEKEPRVRRDCEG